jgi:hypothetical protein
VSFTCFSSACLSLSLSLCSAWIETMWSTTRRWQSSTWWMHPGVLCGLCLCVLVRFGVRLMCVSGVWCLLDI